MRYLIIIKDPETGVQSAFYSSRYDYENLYSAEHDMIVVDLYNHFVTFDGVNWNELETDNL